MAAEVPTYLPAYVECEVTGLWTANPLVWEVLPSVRDVLMYYLMKSHPPDEADQPLIVKAPDESR